MMGLSMASRVDSKFLAFILMASLMSVGLAGCGPSDPRRAVKGKVVLKKEPVKEGVIQFEPLSTGGPTTKSAAVITKGEYSIPADGGLLPGKYRVRISAGDSTAPEDPNQMPGPGGNYVMKDKIPADYNTKSKIEVEVTDKGPNQFDYDIP